jgi:hypothetical protein
MPSHPRVLATSARTLGPDELSPVIAALGFDIQRDSIIDAITNHRDDVLALPLQNQYARLLDLRPLILRTLNPMDRNHVENLPVHSQLLRISTLLLYANNQRLLRTIDGLHIGSDQHIRCISAFPLRLKLEAMIDGFPAQSRGLAWAALNRLNRSKTELADLLLGPNVAVNQHTFDHQFFLKESPAAVQGFEHARVVCVAGTRFEGPKAYPDRSARGVQAPVLEADLKFSWHWQPHWEMGPFHIQFKQGLSQVYYYMHRSETRYGYFLCDQGLICIRRTAGANGAARNGTHDEEPSGI